MIFSEAFLWWFFIKKKKKKKLRNGPEYINKSSQREIIFHRKNHFHYDRFSNDRSRYLAEHVGDPCEMTSSLSIPTKQTKMPVAPLQNNSLGKFPPMVLEAYEIPALSTRLRRRIPRSSYNNNRSTTTEAHISWTDAAWRAFCLYKSSLVHHHRITPSIKIERTGPEYSAFSVNQAYLCSRRASTPPREPPPHRQESAWSAILFTCQVISKSGRITNKHNEDKEN